MNPRITHVPKGWRQSRVGREFIIENKLREPISEEVRKSMQGPYPYYGPTKAVDWLDHFRAEGIYALIGEDGDHFLKFSKQDMTQLVSGRFNVNNHAHIIKGNDECTTEWFYEYFRMRALTPYLTRQGAGRYKLNKTALEELPILVPPKLEQKKIYKYIREWDLAIFTIETVTSEKNKLKKGLMQQLLSGGKRFSGFSKPWRTVHLGEIFKNRTESGREDLPLLSITGEGGIVNRETISRRDTSNKDKSRYIRICSGDIGYNTMRMWQGVSGLSSMEGIISPAYTVVTPDNNSDAEFMATFFKYPPTVNLFRRYSQGLVNDTLNLKFRHFSEIKVTIPGKDEQRKIASVFRIIDQELSLLKQELDLLKEQKKGLMQQLLTGKKRVEVKEVA